MLNWIVSSGAKGQLNCWVEKGRRDLRGSEAYQIDLDSRNLCQRQIDGRTCVWRGYQCALGIFVRSTGVKRKVLQNEQAIDQNLSWENPY